MYGFQMDQGLCSRDSELIVLKSVTVDATLNNILCETKITQLYQNLEDKPVEAVYTFPLASNSLLLDLKVQIGDRTLQGVVTEKKEAEEKYEEAIVEGDRTIMLEQLQDGLYTMNVGNIQPEESVSISFTYSELLIWQADSLHYQLPTTIAPRYGDPEKGGMQPHQIPEYDLFTENRFKLSFKISGLLADAKIACPSHNISVAKENDSVVVSFASGESSMDRDFVLNIEAADINKKVSFVDRDGKGGYITFASFVPQMPDSDKKKGKSIKIVIDCSGSMAGDSIFQAKKALAEILGQLRPIDYFNIILFGSSCKRLFDRQVSANKENISLALRQARNIEANLGGTEIHSAMQAAINSRSPELDQEILLITDGEVWNTENIIKSIAKSEHRVFSVGVGSAVAEGFVQDLAKRTGGACELVSPKEEMATKIVRHFKRIYLPRAESVTVKWPIAPNRSINPNSNQVFDGDTYYAFACFSDKPEGYATLEMELPGGKIQSQKVCIDEWYEPAHRKQAGTISRIGMYHALKNMDDLEATETAVFYQLICPFTNYLVIDKLEDKQKEPALPKLRKISQMMAAGYGGLGTESSATLYKGEVKFCTARRNFDSFTDMENPCLYRTPEMDSSQGIPEPIYHELNPHDFIAKLNNKIVDWIDNSMVVVIDFDVLRKFGLPDHVLGTLMKIMKLSDHQEISEDKMIIVFLHVLKHSEVGEKLDKYAARMIEKCWQVNMLDDYVKEVSDKFKDINSGNWGLKKAGR